MKKKHHKFSAFVLADSLVALSILVMALVWLAMCENQLKVQREKMSNSLRIARLAKESSDGLVVSNKGRFACRDGSYYVIATQDHVAVRRGRQLVWEVKG